MKGCVQLLLIKYLQISLQMHDYKTRRRNSKELTYLLQNRSIFYKSAQNSVNLIKLIKPLVILTNPNNIL